MLLKIIALILPWPLKRHLLRHWFGYELDTTAYIGFAWIFPRKLRMAAGARIAHMNVAVHLDLIDLGKNSRVGRGNWITGFPTETNSRHFKHQRKREAALVLGESAAITKNHHIDCTSLINIGRFATIAGYNSQFLTHTLDVYECRQDSAPIYIGEYAFVGTNVVVLGGAKLPPNSVLSAKSLLNKSLSDEWMLYGGTPAKVIKRIPKSAKYFTRLEGFVY